MTSTVATLFPDEAREEKLTLEQQSGHPGAKWPSGGQGGMGRDQVGSQGVWPELPVDILDSLASLKIRSS